MTIKKEFKTVKDLREFIAQNCSDPDKMFVKEVYNLGDTQPEEAHRNTEL